MHLYKTYSIHSDFLRWKHKTRQTAKGTIIHWDPENIEINFFQFYNFDEDFFYNKKFNFLETRAVASHVLFVLQKN